MSTGDHVRPDPDELLARVQEEETRRARGKLKIFLGYAAGVGKTYAMLEAAHQRQEDGADVVVGYAETHGRAETEAMLAGLEVVPRRPVDYRGTTLSEMDVDAVLARRPQLALVDELAHTNAPGSRHAKRYQDVEELLGAGIDVYTTLNVQHLESLNDVVAQITGVTVRETIPDTVLDEMDSVELIDLPPEELLQRLQEGKVYIPDQAARAIQKFFRQGNLTALRELALRRTAERVDDQMRAYKHTHAIFRPWPAGERVLVCISPNPLSERLVRTGRRLADRLDAEWFVVYVETPGHNRLSEADRDRIARTMRLAEELGAKTVILPGQSIADTVLDYAHSHNVSKIVAGKSLGSHWRELFRGSVVEQIIRHSGDVDVYIISGSTTESPSHQDNTGQRSIAWGKYLQSIILVILISLLGQPLRAVIDPTNLVMIYLLGVVIAAIRWGRGPSILTAILSVLAFDFFFVPPHFTFVVSDAQYILTFVGLLIVGLVISTLAAQAHEQAEAARRREAQTAALYALSRDLTTAVNLDTILQTSIAHVGESFDGQTAIFLPQGEVLLAQGRSNGFAINQDRHAVATWVFRHGQAAGQGTDTLAAADARYLPLKTAQGIIGVMGVQVSPAKNGFTPEQTRLLEAFASQIALAIESAGLAEKARQAQLLDETEKLQTALLNSISHDLRTPLVSITGALSSLRDDASYLDEASRRDLVETASGEAERLNRLVGNLLNMTRLEAGALRLERQLYDMQEVVGVALEQVTSRLRDRAITVDVPANLPPVAVDIVLIAQALVNLLDNAMKYSPPDRPIEVRARAIDSEMFIQVADYGSGIPTADLERIFEKFYRGEHSDHDQSSGTGLGLSISRGIVEAHGGRVWVENRPSGGLVATIALPVGEAETIREEVTHE